MRDRHLVVCEIELGPTTGQKLSSRSAYAPTVDALEIGVSHMKGGTNMFSGNDEPAAYWLTGEIYTSDGTHRTTIIGDRRGARVLIEKAKAYSAKRLAALTEELKREGSPLRESAYKRLLEIMRGNGVVIPETQEQKA